MNEIWKEIEGFEGYFVSSTGHVKGDKGILNEARTNNRVQIGMKSCGKWGRYDVSRLVAKAFLPNPYGLNTVIHKDGNYYNNDVSNLEWCSRSECPKISRRVTKKTDSANMDRVKANSRRRAVFQIDRSGAVVGRYPSIQSASRITNVSLSGINKCVKGQNTTAGGFRWAYADEW